MKGKLSRNRPLISVIMSVYNAEDFLMEAIESILNQTISDFEFLIVDDHSSDDSWKIIRKYAKKDKRIKVFQNKTRKGLVLSLNFLIPKTLGVYVARMDADDISLPKRFEEQVAFLNDNKDFVACGGQEYIIDEKDKIIAEKYFPTDPRICYNFLMNFMVIQPPLLMARGSIFRMFRYNNHIFQNDDITIHFKLIKMGQFGNVDKVIFKYRKRNNSLTHLGPKNVFFLALKARIYAILKENYRPSFANIILAGIELFAVLLIPERWIVPIFEYCRHVKPAYTISVALKKLLC